MKDKLVSVIIPTYRGSDALMVALESIYRQSYKNFEVIVADDNGPGETEQLKTAEIIEYYAKKMTINYLVKEHVNGSHARNNGLEVAKGDYICFLDDDDFYLPQYLEKAVKALETNPQKAIVFFDVIILNKEGTCRKVSNDKISSKDILLSKKEIGTGSNLFFRQKVYKESGGFDERYLRFQDFEFITKKLNCYDSLWIKEKMIVKFFNQTDNFLNYEKSLKMQELYRQDSLEKGLITAEELQQIQNLQLHNLYKDMLAKNMPKTDIRRVYSIMKQAKINGIMDSGMLAVYSVSKKLFNLFFKSYMLLVYGNKEIRADDLVNYRQELKESYDA